MSQRQPPKRIETRYVTAAEMREMDRWAINDIGIPGVVLMENAGQAVYRKAVEMLLERSGTTIIFCGRGNNGGDGYAVARHLFNSEFPIEVKLVGSRQKVRGDALVNLQILERMGVQVEEITDTERVMQISAHLDDYGLIVDALLGTGLEGEVQGLYRDLIIQINNAQTPVLSVDVPSGLNTDTGEPLGVAVKADRTVTFQFPKVGFKRPEAEEYIGKLVVADIGIPEKLWEKRSQAFVISEQRDRP